jgi:hypothetical protein
MCRVKCPLRTYATAGEPPLPDSFYETAIGNLRALIVALMVALAGCATPTRPPVLIPPPAVSESTWWEVDSDISAASLDAKKSAENYARDAMARWRTLVQKRTETDFIPWFTDYWTQQWLVIKAAWYKLSAEKGTDPTVERLAAYLQEQYHDRVLAPVAREIDPNFVREQATKLYVQSLSKQLQAIPQRHGVPSEQFDRRIKEIPAIALASPPVPSASLYQIVHADPIAKLPAYEALIAQIRKGADDAGIGLSDARLLPVAKRASEKLETRLATSGGAGAAAAAVGGVPGVLISLGATVYGAIQHENERPYMEARIRENLALVLDDMWTTLMDDPDTGVMAGVDHLSRQIDGSLAKTFTQPVTFEPLPRGVPLPGEDPGKDEQGSGETQLDDGGGDQ